MLAFNRPGLHSFHEKDHGARDGSSLQIWMKKILDEYKLRESVCDVFLLCMPRVLGYVFNPVSFWLCLDREGQLRAVLCEVNNTFGETHSYLCVHNDRRVIGSQDWLEAQKMFHVSPFFPRDGYYRFRFSVCPEHLGIWIDYYSDSGQRRFLSSLSGDLCPLSHKKLCRAFWSHPLLGWKTISAIHWQGLKLFLHKTRYFSKPEQYRSRRSPSRMD